MEALRNESVLWGQVRRHVVELLRRPNRLRRRPRWTTVDDGSEFVSQVLDLLAHWHKVQLDFIRPGKPVENAFFKSFNGRLRQECLTANWFASLEEARMTIESWRKEYNSRRPHNALGGLSRQEFLRALRLYPSTESAEILTL